MRGVAQRIPNVRRYALVPNDSNNGVRRFHLARVASAPAPQRLERMEDVAAREISPQGGGSDPPPRGEGLTP
jgi:hypothetical protein